MKKWPWLQIYALFILYYISNLELQAKVYLLSGVILQIWHSLKKRKDTQEWFSASVLKLKVFLWIVDQRPPLLKYNQVIMYVIIFFYYYYIFILIYILICHIVKKSLKFARIDHVVKAKLTHYVPSTSTDRRFWNIFFMVNFYSCM